MFKKKSLYILTLSIILMIISCSPKKNTWVSRNYNNLAAHYNAYYNGNESFKTGELSLKKGTQDDFTKILTLFPYSGKENAGKVQGEMEVAIGKGQKIIRKYSITAKPKRKPGRNNPTYEAFYNQREFNKWVDDAYMLMGKAHLYNQKYYEAIVMFDYVMREYHNKPVRFDAAIWTARTRIEMEDFDNALIMLKWYDDMGQAPNRYYGDFMATYADYYIRKQQYIDAIPYLKTAMSSATGKWKKTRWNYVLGQLYMLNNQNKEAKACFKKVIRANPEYEMNMNSRLNIAVLTARGDGNYAEARKILNKLAKQTKNKEFRDRIYYTLAQTYLDEGDTTKTISNLQLSAEYNINNQPLKRETHLKLGELYFDVEKYVPSYTYYDSALMILPELDNRKKDIKFRHEGLKELSSHYSVILREDSLQKLAKMDSKERDAFLEAIIAQKRAEKLESERRQQEAAGGMGSLEDPFFNNSLRNQQGQNDNKGQWYFYNISTVSLGKIEFEKRWGRRPSEDNWRRSDKSISDPRSSHDSTSHDGESADSEDDTENTEDGKVKKQSPSSDGIPTKEQLLADIPLTEELMEISDNKLAIAYFNTGMVFYDHFKDLPKAARDFRIMFERYPNHRLTDEDLFWAYRSYLVLGDERSVEEIRQILKKNFPDSRYTEFACDPRYADKHLKKEKADNDTYELAFSAYLSGRFMDAYTSVKELTDTTVNVSLIRKSHLLRAMSQGRMSNNSGFKYELQIIADKYPTTQEGILARKWLAMLDEGRMPIPGQIVSSDGTVISGGADGTASSAELYVYEPDAKQELVLIIDGKADFNKLFFNLADYNFTRFIITDYDIDSKFLSDGNRVITVGLFGNEREVMDYFYSIRDHSALFNVENIGEPVILAGSENNVKAFFSSGDVTGFKNFFIRYYLKGSTGVLISIDETSKLQIDDKDEFKQFDGRHWGLIVTNGRFDESRVRNFLVNQAVNSIMENINVRMESLLTGENVIILESFESVEKVNAFFDSLKGNNFWETQIKAKNWTKVPIAPDNFRILKEGKSVKDYLEFLE